LGNYYLISTKLDPGSVIDKKHSDRKVGLQVFPTNKPETDNQLWQFVPDPEGTRFCLIKTKVGLYVIDVKGGNPSATGTPLQAHIQNESGFDDNQLWEFVPDPAGSGYFFIKSKLGDYVIDIKGASAAPHTPLQLFPQNPPEHIDNQLWICRPELGSTFNPKVRLQVGDSSSIRVSGDGFVALSRISLWYTLTDPARGVSSSTGSDPIIAQATVHGAFECNIPSRNAGSGGGSTLEATAADGTNRVNVKALLDAHSNSWKLV